MNRETSNCPFSGGWGAQWGPRDYSSIRRAAPWEMAVSSVLEFWDTGTSHRAKHLPLTEDRQPVGHLSNMYCTQGGLLGTDRWQWIHLQLLLLRNLNPLKQIDMKANALCVSTISYVKSNDSTEQWQSVLYLEPDCHDLNLNSTTSLLCDLGQVP